eukprot:2946538-Rhodomonas_salina.1
MEAWEAENGDAEAVKWRRTYFELAHALEVRHHLETSRQSVRARWRNQMNEIDLASACSVHFAPGVRVISPRVSVCDARRSDGKGSRCRKAGR